MVVLELQGHKRRKICNGKGYTNNQECFFVISDQSQECFWGVINFKMLVRNIINMNIKFNSLAQFT